MRNYKRATMLTSSKEGGFVLVTVLLMLLVMTLIGMTLSYKIMSTVKISGITQRGTKRFYGSEGGVYSVASYLTKNKRVDAPVDVKKNGYYEVTTEIIDSNMQRLQVGGSSAMQGATVKINSVSHDGKSEVEAVVFIPTNGGVTVGYPND